MSSAITYENNTAGIEAIAAHLSACDKHFVPPLSGRVDIAAYAAKIAARAQRFEASTHGQLIGLVAAYCNDPLRETAYITSVSVLPAWHGRQVASQLIERCIAHAKSRGFSRVELKASKANEDAIKLYLAQGFVADSQDDDWVTLRLGIGA